jgi:hypothetical protein
MNNSTTAVDNQNPTLDVQQAMESTRENSAMQTIIALEQLTNTPTPEAFSNLPKPWTEITTITPTPTSTPHSAIASVVKPATPILLGPDWIGYRMVCYVDKGTQLMIIGRNSDSSWLRVTFGQGQTCFILDANSNSTYFIPDPTWQFWISSSSITISGDLSEVVIIAPTATPTPKP